MKERKLIYLLIGLFALACAVILLFNRDLGVKGITIFFAFAIGGSCLVKFWLGGE